MNASDSVYDGKLSADERRALHGKSLSAIAGMIAKEDAGRWTSRMTDLVIVDDQAEEPKTLSPWMTR